jgi:hypothetical protein
MARRIRTEIIELETLAERIGLDRLEGRSPSSHVRKFATALDAAQTELDVISLMCESRAAAQTFLNWAHDLDDALADDQLASVVPLHNGPFSRLASLVIFQIDQRQ